MRWKSMLVATVPLLLLAILAVVAVVISEITGDGTQTGSAQSRPVAPIDSPLLTSNRSLLSMCVDSIGGASASATDVGELQGTLGELRAELAQRGFDDTVLRLVEQSEVTIGCPPAAAVDDHNRFVDPKTGSVRVIGSTTTVPSEHRAYIYIVSKDVFQGWFGDVPFAIGTEEVTCSGDQCAGVTSGLYISEASTSDDVLDGLRGVLGFNDPFDILDLPPTPTPSQ